MKPVLFFMFVMLTLPFMQGCTLYTSSVAEPQAVTLRHGVDTTAGGLAVFIIETPTATYYLDKKGGGLSSLIDADGNDWIGFAPTPGSGWQGEYRGFPNAVHKQDGNYFHPVNASTDLSSSHITHHSAKHVQITVDSGNKQWQAVWDFYPDRLDFSMAKVSQGYTYWVQFEGVPGGTLNDSDFYYNSAAPTRRNIQDSFHGDLPSPEWYAFGDTQASSMLYLLHHTDDTAPDSYEGRPFMTVLGFGRQHKNKYLTTPSRFSLGFIRSHDYHTIKQKVTALSSPTP